MHSILIVDDEANMLVMLDRVLTREGYTVHTAQDGKHALDLIAKHSFQAAILDVRMYPMDGVTLLRIIKEQLPAIQVIMITGYSTSDTHEQAMQNGAAAYLGKPVDIPAFKKLLRDLV